MTKNSDDSYITHSYDQRQKANNHADEPSDQWGMFAQTALNGIMGGTTSWFGFKAIMHQYDKKLLCTATEDAKQINNGSAWLETYENFITSVQRRILPNCPLHYGIIAGGILAGVTAGYLVHSAIKEHEKEQLPQPIPSPQIDAATAQRDAAMLTNNPAITNSAMNKS
ncbi:MAG: hypothetical protein EAY65_01210 [Alphaproteobacteria bacterium]|nr:MAG: hypothetical protein EAY65_01210 [Alphaproteobacteria bacterium]